MTMLPLEARCTLCGMKALATSCPDCYIYHFGASFVGGMTEPGAAFSELWLNARVIWTLTAAGTLTAPETTACRRRIDHVYYWATDSCFQGDGADMQQH